MKWIVLALLVLAVLWMIWTYNLLVSLRHRIQNGWKQIGVQLKRRHDLIPNLVEAAKGYMKYEQDTLQKLVYAYQNPESWVTTGNRGIFAYPRGEEEAQGLTSDTFKGAFRLILQTLLRLILRF